MSLVLVDSSVKTSVGLLDDILVMISDYQISTDFVVLKMDHEPKDPLILGRPFLATAEAITNIKNGKINLHLNDDVMQFGNNEVMKKSEERDHIFYINDLDLLSDSILDEVKHNDKDPSERFQTLQNGDMADMIPREMAYASLTKGGEEEEATVKASDGETYDENDWSKLKEPKEELKPLLKGLRYAFLGPNSTYPIIISDEQNDDETSMLLYELKKYKKTIYSLDDIKGISPSLCMH